MVAGQGLGVEFELPAVSHYQATKGAAASSLIRRPPTGQYTVAILIKTQPQ